MNTPTAPQPAGDPTLLRHVAMTASDTGSPPAGTQTDTPRTDREAILPGDRRRLYEYVPADFARQLERELAALRQQLKGADKP